MRATYFRILLWIYIAMCLYVVCTGIPLWHRLLKHRDSRKVSSLISNMTRGDKARVRGTIRILQFPRSYKRLVDQLQNHRLATDGARWRHGRPFKTVRRKSRTYNILRKKLAERRRKFMESTKRTTHPTASSRKKLFNSHMFRNRKGLRISKTNFSLYLRRYRTRRIKSDKTGNKLKKKRVKQRHHDKKYGRRKKFSFIEIMRAKRARKEWFLSHYGGKVAKAKQSKWPHIVPCPNDDPQRFYCLNGGKCIYVGGLDVTTCNCPENYKGLRCESRGRGVLPMELSNQPRKPANVDWFSR